MYAEAAMSEALRLSGLSPTTAEDLYKRLALGEGHEYEHRLSIWQIAPDQSKERTRATSLFMEAGRGFVKRGKLDVLDVALKCFHWSLWSSQHSKGKMFRKNESAAAHCIWEIYLTWMELSSLDENRWRELSNLAARYMELEGYIESEHGDQQEAARAYRSASLRYWYADRHEQAARSAAKESTILESLEDPKGAGQARATEARCLLAAAKQTPESDRSDFLRHARIRALCKSARLLARVDDIQEKRQAADTFIAGAKEALQQANWDEPEMVFDSLEQAKKLYQSMGKFNKVDETYYLEATYRRGLYAKRRCGHFHPAYLLSLCLDVMWGYGIRPIRLLPVSTIVIIVFTIIYLLRGDVNWEQVPVAMGSPMIHYVPVCLTLSATSLIPAQLIEQVSNLHLFPVINVGAGSLIVVWIESLLGLGICTMAVSSIVRWFTRRFVAR